ncbi:ferritin family protein [Thermodesulfobacteriota bacterium]
MQEQEVCYTKETALEKAIEMEGKSFEVYKLAYLKAKDRRSKDLLRDFALDELKHKYTLEKAFFEEVVLLHDTGPGEGSTMKLNLLLEEKPLDEDASVQDIMIYAIHEEKRAVDFYASMMDQCGGAPMEEMFRRLYQDEESHLARLEEFYENAYMQAM